MLLLPGPPSGSGKTLVTAGPIPTDGKPSGKMLWSGPQVCGQGETAPPGGRAAHSRGLPRAGRLGVQILSGWGSGSGVCRSLLGSQGSVSPAGQVPTGPRKRHYSAQTWTKAPLSQAETMGPGHPAALHLRGKAVPLSAPFISFHYKVVLKSILRLVELQMQPKNTLLSHSAASDSWQALWTAAHRLFCVWGLRQKYWVCATSLSRGSSSPGTEPESPCGADSRFSTGPPGKPKTFPKDQRSLK